MTHETPTDRIASIVAEHGGRIVRRQDYTGADRTDSFFVHFDAYKADACRAAKWDAIEAIREAFPTETAPFGLFDRKSRGFTCWRITFSDGNPTGELRVGFEVRAR